MIKSGNHIEVFLQPGELYFADHATRIRTILGSCVSITFWHPVKLIGGMTHIMLPERGQVKQNNEIIFDGRYANEAIQLVLNEMKGTGTHPSEYQVKLFGGGNMFTHHSSEDKQHIGTRNSTKATTLLRQYGFSLHAEDSGGIGHRSIVFDTWSGDVWVKHTPLI